MLPSSAMARWRAVATVCVAPLALLALVYAGLSAYVATQATLVKRHVAEGSPADLGLRFEEVAFTSAAPDPVPLRGWYLAASGTRAVVMVHGIDGHRWDTFHHVDRLAALLVNHGYDVLTFDLRGSGESGGERLGLAWLERLDVAAAVQLVRERGIPAGHIGVWGQSFGGHPSPLARRSVARMARRAARLMVAVDAPRTARPLPAIPRDRRCRSSVAAPPRPPPRSG